MHWLMLQGGCTQMFTSVEDSVLTWKGGIFVSHKKCASVKICMNTVGKVLSGAPLVFSWRLKISQTWGFVDWKFEDQDFNIRRSEDSIVIFPPEYLMLQSEDLNWRQHILNVKIQNMLLCGGSPLCHACNSSVMLACLTLKPFNVSFQACDFADSINCGIAGELLRFLAFGI